jgi:hypothetical protein
MPGVTMAKASKNTKLPSIAAYLARQIDSQATLGKTQQQIAIEVGYERPNIIAMMCSGDVKVPIDKVPALARALDVDPVLLLRMALQQYWPNSAAAIAEIFGTLVTKNEVKVLETIRSATNNSDPVVTPALERKLRRCFE